MIGIYLFTIGKPAVHVVHYTLNYGTYANELCENKDKPQLNCNGTCILAQKLNMLETPAEKEIPALPIFEGLHWYIALLDEEPPVYYPVYRDLTTRLCRAHNNYTSPTFTPPTPPPNGIV